MFMRRQQMVKLHKFSIPKKFGGKCPAHGRKLRRCRIHQVLITCRASDRGVADLIVSRSRISPQMGRDDRPAILELHDRRHMKNVLIVSRKQKRLVALDGATDCPSELMLLIARIEAHKCRSRASQLTVAQKIKCASMPLVRARLGDYVYNRAPSPPRLRSIAARLHS